MGMPRRRPTVDISHKHGTLVLALEGEILVAEAIGDELKATEVDGTA
jgi:hypothetical protein